MTSMQVEYSKFKETQKHNRAMESQAAAELGETIVHNRNTEQETASHNRAMEFNQAEANRINQYLGDLNSWTQIKTTEMRNANELEKQALVNQGQRALKNADLAYQMLRDTLDRKLEKVRTTAQAKLNDAQRSKVDKEIYKIKRETENLNSELVDKHKQANAALKQAEAALKNAQTNVDNLERQKALDAADKAFKAAQTASTKGRNTREWFSFVESQIEKVGTAIDKASGSNTPVT